MLHNLFVLRTREFRCVSHITLLFSTLEECPCLCISCSHTNTYNGYTEQPIPSRKMQSSRTSMQVQYWIFSIDVYVTDLLTRKILPKTDISYQHQLCSAIIVFSNYVYASLNIYQHWFLHSTFRHEYACFLREVAARPDDACMRG